MNSKPSRSKILSCAFLFLEQITLSLPEVVLYGGLTLLAGFGLSYLVKTKFPSEQTKEPHKRTYTKKTTTLLVREGKLLRLVFSIN
jgi:hypothetical protein